MSRASRYQVRTEALAAIGFDSYKAYLRSPLWATIKQRILDRDQGLCRVCQKPAYTAHHTTYSEAVLQGLDDSQLMAICKGCHRGIEFDQDRKLTYTTDIYAKASGKMLANLGGKASKKARKKLQPKCRCCERQYKALGRNDICMGCYKSGRALEFVNAST